MYVYFLNQKTTEMTVDTLKRVTFPRNTKNIIYIIYIKKKNNDCTQIVCSTHS